MYRNIGVYAVTDIIKQKNNTRKREAMEKKERVYSKAIVKYGMKTQLTVVIEEMAELQKEISKHIRGIGEKANLIEEIADVEIMLEQLKMMYCINDFDVESIKDLKIDRLEKRLKGEE